MESCHTTSRENKKTHSTFFIYFRKNLNRGEFSKSVDFRTFLSDPKVRLNSKIYKMFTGLKFPTIPACRLQMRLSGMEVKTSKTLFLLHFR